MSGMGPGFRRDGGSEGALMLEDVELGPEQEAFIASCIADGRYASSDEVIAAALRLLQARELDPGRRDD